jgi:heme exporter protein D
MSVLVAWMSSMWFVWIAVGLCILALIVAAVVGRAVAKSRAHIPQYRRH